MQALRVVKAIADEGSITGAAASLGYSQPAISQQLKRLEQRLGVPLDRAGRPQRAPHRGGPRPGASRPGGDDGTGCRSRRTRRAARACARGACGSSAFPSASPTDRAAAARRPRRASPRHHDHLRRGRAARGGRGGARGPRRHRADLQLSGRPRRSARLERPRARRCARSAPTICSPCCPSATPPRRETRVDVAELADENWIAGCPRCRGHLLELCGRAGFEPRIAFETDNFVAVEGLVAQGIGVATLPRMAVESFPQLPGVDHAPAAARRGAHAPRRDGARCRARPRGAHRPRGADPGARLARCRRHTGRAASAN